MNKFSKLITVVAFAIFALSTSLFAQEKTSKVADAEMKAALIKMNAHLYSHDIPDKGVVDLEAIKVRDKIIKSRSHPIIIYKKKKNVSSISKRMKDIFEIYFPTRYYPWK